MDFLEEIEAAVPAIRRFAHALVQDREAADELVEDCLQRALARGAQWRRDGTVKVWLFRILLNRYRDQLRRRRPRPMMAVAGGAGFNHTQHGHNSHDGAFSFDEVQAALARLPADQRAALLLVALEEMNIEEAARLLTIPRGRMLSRLARARSTFTQMLGQEDAPRSAAR
ncbi:sigma-70 family RNA polymerase sigma factor [Solirhodobacter olei]|uniref:sigma-70 family RNA polymerase sigma factor n=1 Tax=Solirhodobacter olei TaxID=2493082 RepID=UPI000FDA1295|nr:sigma-70 family RNA polymerase sigma factor [Solirhodobacter olei]